MVIFYFSEAGVACTRPNISLSRLSEAERERRKDLLEEWKRTRGGTGENVILSLSLILPFLYVLGADKQERLRLANALHAGRKKKMNRPYGR